MPTVKTYIVSYHDKNYRFKTIEIEAVGKTDCIERFWDKVGYNSIFIKIEKRDYGQQ